MQPNNPNPQRPILGGPRPQSFDVVRPGRTPASPNARPTLAPNTPPVADNSMKMGAPAVPPGLMSSLRSTPTPVAQSPQPAPAAVRPQPMPRPQVAAPAPIGRPTPPAMPQYQNPDMASMGGPVNPTPIFEPTTLEDQQPAPVKHSIWSEVLAIIAILVLIGIIVDILLDAKVINLPIPHTNFFDY